MKKLLCIVTAAALLLAMGACQGAAPTPAVDPTSDPAVNTAVGETLASANLPQSIPYDDYDAQRSIRTEYPITEDSTAAFAAFCRSSAAQLLTADRNNCYSPVSLYYALAVAASGADGDTRTQMLSLLQVKDGDALAELCRNLYQNLYFKNEFGSLHLGTSLWASKNCSFHEDYLQQAADAYYASVFRTDFADPAAGSTMSRWVSEQTNGLLQPQIEPDTETLLSILSTAYLKDEWTNAFQSDMTKSGTFNCADGSKATIDFMHRTTSGSFVRGENFLRAELRTKNNASMVFILPDENTPLADFLTEQGLAKALGEAPETYGEIIWSIPKFSFGSRYDLADSLKKLGVVDAFSAQSANFSQMTEEPLFLSEAVQEAHISIDENGMEAGAYTELGFAGAGMPQDTAEMNLNRPFLFAVEKDNVILFIGTCCNFSA